MKSLAKTSYVMTFFSDKEKFVKISEDQYRALKPTLNDVRFVEVDGNLYNVADIKGMSRKVETGLPLGHIAGKPYYSDEEYEELTSNYR